MTSSFEPGKTTLKQVKEAKKAYQEAITAHRKQPYVTLAEGTYIKELKARALVLIEAYKLGV